MGLKPKVLVFIDWFLPGYQAGGPIKSVANIVKSLKHEVDFSIITSNTDFGVSTPYDGIESNTWLAGDGYRVMYLDTDHQKLSFYREVLKENNFDILYFNSLFSIPYTLLPLLALKMSAIHIKTVLAPRGMLGPGALELKKSKKKVFLASTKLLGLFNKITWHASTHIEANEIKAVFGKNSTVKVATNIASSAPTQASQLFIKTKDNTAFFFLSRISPKKNLLGALNLLSKVSLKNKITFDIIGPVEDEKYWQQCQALISKLPSNFDVNYKGPIPNLQLPSFLQNYHFLLLPTFSENYGHVVVEAWANGCGVILSDQTPWQNLESAQVGWDIPLGNEQKFADVIKQCVVMENDEFSQIQRQIESYMKERVVTEEIIDQNRSLFKI